ncbi:MAG TPA: chromosome segregation protein SMC [Devosia sp.]|nr:chromosome segregation protein SMC [Devosia sp.]
MKFQRLRLHGFKSFSDPTDLHLEPGLTGVVGPNGCGKSNLVEAMRWVMGESSYKAMRASGMDDVIFSGSANRPGRNTAEVTLVLDNSDRSAPSLLNDSDILEVTRRIERENGSVYRVNGREVRARDVQLLFADASTGAHSPSLVRQGQIGELIAAKPVKRRALLEEAAGISGLHSRRHEAELRLRGAEQNLERVDDIIAQVEGQLENLKKQARLATRYRNISGDIRKAEATLYHVRWVKARVAEKETEALQGKTVNLLAEATHKELESAKALEVAKNAIAPVRAADVSSGAAVQRLSILREQLETEIRRADSRRAELEDRQIQIGADLEREVALVAEADALLNSYKLEKSALAGESETEAEAEDQAREAAQNARSDLVREEACFREATEARAQLAARRAQAARSAKEAKARAARLRSQIAEVEREADKVRLELSSDSEIVRRRAELDAARLAAKTAEAEAVAAEKASQAAREALESARPGLNELETRQNSLEIEAETLASVLNLKDNNLWPAIVDTLKVTTGYEVALGAALGDDLEASSDSGAPIYWADPGDGPHDPQLPDGATPLSRFVEGAGILKRGLDQIGIIDAGDGARMMTELKPGQRLVTLEGDLWRWDGLIAKADAPNAAAQRLSQHNRLAELDLEISQGRASVNAAQAQLNRLSADSRQAQSTESTLRESWRQAQHKIETAQNAFDVAQRAAGDLATRQSALEEARVRLQSSLSEAEEIEADATKTLADCQSEEDAGEALQVVEARLRAARSADEQARLALSSFESAGRLRNNRIAQLEQEMSSWARRRESAIAQAANLRNRGAEIAAQLATLDQTPEGFADKREALDRQLEDARQAQKVTSDKLAQAEHAYRELDRQSREASGELGEIRAEMARIDERLKGLVSQRRQIEQAVQENLGISADKTAEVAGIRAEAALPDEHQTERRLERLKTERQRLGGVNLSAEQEAKETREKLETMVADRNDLIAAISKLRTGISSLNREGRARLNDAFDKVNSHFQDLFTSLFGGGAAELTFVESDDPLEAGLEILARPPGKKPQVLSLLSGGEQALTALALIFAVFLTNPAPICVLDEVDAPLDDANVERFCNLLDSMCERTHTRFLVITHNPITMSRVDRLFGVTMAERGVSQLVSVDLATAQAVREAV